LFGVNVIILGGTDENIWKITWFFQLVCCRTEWKR